MSLDEDMPAEVIIHSRLPVEASGQRRNERRHLSQKSLFNFAGFQVINCPLSVRADAQLGRMSANRPKSAIGLN